jgi:hypothetical protein
MLSAKWMVYVAVTFKPVLVPAIMLKRSCYRLIWAQQVPHDPSLNIPSSLWFLSFYSGDGQQQLSLNALPFFNINFLMDSSAQKGYQWHKYSNLLYEIEVGGTVGWRRMYEFEERLGLAGTFIHYSQTVRHLGTYRSSFVHRTRRPTTRTYSACSKSMFNVLQSPFQSPNPARNSEPVAVLSNELDIGSSSTSQV